MRLLRHCTRSTTGRILLVLGISGLWSCGVETSSNTSPPPIPVRVDRLAAWMTGSFEPTPSEKTDAGFQDLRIDACRIWPERIDGRWLYLEVGDARSLEPPQRQRILRVKIDDQGWLVSEAFAFPARMAPEAGAWRNPSSLNLVDPALLEPLEGCTLFFDDGPDDFTGRIRGRGCESDAPGATYVTREVVIAANSLSVWDRGYDDQDRQIRGSRTGPTIFLRVSSR